MAEERPATQRRQVVTAAAEAKAALGALAAAPDEAIDLAEAALALSALARPSIDLAPYRRHLEDLAADVTKADAHFLADAVEALNMVIIGDHGYRGDADTYDDLDNADLARVIDRRKGLPVALGILYLHAARAQGWSADGLGFPGHFLIRIEHDDEAAVVDPFHDGNVLDATGLRGLLKAISGYDAELEPHHWEAVTNREVLIRLQNNIRTRCLQSGDAKRALGAIEAMLLFAPDHAELWRDAGVLNAQLGNLGAAVDALEHCVARSGAGADRDDAERLLREIRRRLN